MKDQNIEIELRTSNETQQLHPRCIKARLFHLNGQQSEIMTIMPFYTSWFEPYEKAVIQLREYVYGLAKYWVQIDKFEIEIGKIVAGKFVPSCAKYDPYIIPINMVFHEGTIGEWVTREEAIKRGYQY